MRRPASPSRRPAAGRPARGSGRGARHNGGPAPARPRGGGRAAPHRRGAAGRRDVARTGVRRRRIVRPTWCWRTSWCAMELGPGRPPAAGLPVVSGWHDRPAWRGHAGGRLRPTHPRTGDDRLHLWADALARRAVEAALAGLGAALSGPLLVYERYVMAETLLTAQLVGAACALLLARRAGRPASSVGWPSPAGRCMPGWLTRAGRAAAAAGLCRWPFWTVGRCAELPRCLAGRAWASPCSPSHGRWSRW